MPVETSLTAPPERSHGLPPAPLPTIVEALRDHGPELYRFLRRQAPSAEEAADLHQETFLRAVRAYPRLTADANVRAWLFRIASNLATDAYRRRREAVEISETERSRHAGPEAAALGSDLRGAVRAALADLGDRQRTAVVLHVFEGWDYADVAETLDCTEVTARKHVSLGLARLREALAPWR